MPPSSALLGALTPEFRIGETVIVSSALRTDAISDKYLPPAPVVDADAAFVEALREAMGSTTQQVRTWTVPVPYRSTRHDLDEARDAGTRVVEMEIATLFAVCRALEIRAAASVVISDVHRVDNWEVDWSDTTQPTVDAVESTIAAIRRMATS